VTVATEFRLARTTHRTHVVNCAPSLIEGTLSLALCRRGARLGPATPIGVDASITCTRCAAKFAQHAVKEASLQRRLAQA
jgi:hypothetical protein